MSSDHRAITPEDERVLYTPGSYVNFILSYQDMALLPSVHLAGQVRIKNSSTGADVGVNDLVYFNERAGIHGVIQSIDTGMEKVGSMEYLADYGRYVSTKQLGLELPLERGTTTPSAREFRVPTKENTRAICQSCTSAAPRSFCAKLQCVVNTLSRPANYSETGEVKIRIRLADADTWLIGNFTYELTGLRIVYKVVPQVKVDIPLTVEVINSSQQTLNSTTQTLSMFIPTGATDHMIGSLIKSSHLTDSTYDSLACEACPGYVPGTGNTVNDRYGFNRIIYSVNDVDSAPINFNLETREEIIVNFLRALRKDWQYKYAYNLEQLNNGGIPDGYAIGVNFGGLINFSQQKFSMQLESRIDVPYNIYMFSRSLVQVGA